MSTTLSGRLESALAAAPVLGIVRTDVAKSGHLVVAAFTDAGIRAVEISLASRDALSEFAQARETVASGAIIGIGTVRTAAEADAAIDAGAEFLVSPNLSEGVVSRANRAGVPIVCGVMTPTEVQRAVDLGITWLKIFPAGTLGPDYIADLVAPFPDVALVPTGGVRLSDIATYRRAGAAGVGLSGALATAEEIRSGDWNAVGERVGSALEAWTAGGAAG